MAWPTALVAWLSMLGSRSLKSKVQSPEEEFHVSCFTFHAPRFTSRWLTFLPQYGRETPHESGTNVLAAFDKK